MIRSFHDKETLAFYEGKRVKTFDGVRDQATRRLQMLDDATGLSDLAGVPGNRLEALRGNRRGQYSMRINAQWRVCLRWGADGAYEVEIVDYH